MYQKSFLRPILIVGLIIIIFASCDKDFNEIGTDIVGDDHFGFDIDSLSTVKAYNQKLGPIASNNLPINPSLSLYFAYVSLNNFVSDSLVEILKMKSMYFLSFSLTVRIFLNL